MFRNLRIGVRLGLAMGLCLLTTVVIAALGYSGIARVSDMTASMLAHEAQLASVSAAARADTQAMRRFEKELSVLQSGRKPRFEELVHRDRPRPAYAPDNHGGADGGRNGR